MHILIPVLHRPTKPTGVCRHAANLAKCLARQDTITKVSVVTGTWQRDYFEDTFGLTDEKIDLIGVDIKNSAISRNLWFLFGLPKLAKQLKPTLVHLSFPFPFIRHRFECPVVSTLHDLYPYECPENFGFPQVWVNRLFLDQCIRSSDGIACVSAVTLKALEQHFGKVTERKNTTVVYNYVDFSEIVGTRPHKLDQDELNENTDFLMSVAQHRKNKNLDLLIQAYAQLRETEKIAPETQLIIVGSPGPETENLLALIKQLNLSEQVKMLSSISDEELCWLYKHTKLFVIPSSTEGFCIPLVEALTLGSKAVCSDLPIFREVGHASNCHFFDLSANSRSQEDGISRVANELQAKNSRNQDNCEKSLASQSLASSMAVAIGTQTESNTFNESTNASLPTGSTDKRFTQNAVAQAYLAFYQPLT